MPNLARIFRFGRLIGILFTLPLALPAQPASNARATEVLKASAAAYHGARALSTLIYRRTLMLVVQSGDGGAATDYQIAGTGYQTTTLKVRLPFNLYVESRESWEGGRQNAMRAFVMAKAGQNKGRFGYVDADDGRLPEPIDDELFLVRLRGSLGVSPATVAEYFLLGSDNGTEEDAMDFSTARVVGEESYLQQPAYQIEVRSAQGTQFKLWIAKGTFLVLRSLVCPAKVNSAEPARIVVETIYRSTLNPEFTTADFAFKMPTPGNELSGPAMGFVTTTEPLTFVAEHTARKPASAPVQPVSTLPGVLLIEGEHSIATGFAARVHNLPWVVTNLRVLEENESVTVKNMQGETVPVQGIIGAVGADIALLRISNPDSVKTLLPLAAEVFNTFKVGAKVAVVGNRLGGGVATEVAGEVRGLGPNRLDVSADFQPGNGGGPIVSLATGEVIAVAAWAQEAPPAEEPAPVRGRAAPPPELTWFGARFDAVTRWETIDPNKWRAQCRRMETFRKNSLALAAFATGNLIDARLQPEIAKDVDRYLERTNQPASAISTTKKIPGYYQVKPFLDTQFKPENVGEFRDLLRYVRAFADSDTREFSAGDFYDYFRTNLSWASNVGEQLKYRKSLEDALKALEAEAAVQAKLPHSTGVVPRIPLNSD